MNLTRCFFSLIFLLSTYCPVMAQDSLLRAITIRKDTINLLGFSTKKVIVVLANNYTCMECYKKIANEFRNIDSSFYTKLVLCRVGTSAIERRTFQEKISALLPGFTVVFEIQTSQPDPYPPVMAKDGIFGLGKVAQTPALTIIDPSSGKLEKFWRYFDLFNNTGAISDIARTEYQKILQ